VPDPSFLAFEQPFESQGFYDGAVLEYRVSGGEWADAGSVILENGYNTHISAFVGSEMANRDAWSGFQDEEQTVVVDLSRLAGETVSFRWIVAADITLFLYDDSGVRCLWRVANPRLYQLEVSCAAP
jgi:hypothetical protein